MVWAMVAATVASSLLSSSEKDNTWKAKASNAGKSRANVEASAARARAMLPARQKEVASNALLSTIEAEKQGAAATAQATVEAAAAGVSGANVDQTIQQVQANAADVRGQIEKQRRAGMLQIAQDKEDIFWDETTNQSDIEVNTGGGGFGRALLGAGIAGAGTFAVNR